MSNKETSEIYKHNPEEAGKSLKRILGELSKSYEEGKMTIKEAITQFKDLKRDRESFFNNDGDDDIFRADAEACEIAAEKLEKLVPKKPNIHADGYDYYGNIMYDNYDSYDCPSCHTSYKMEYDKYDYCPHCGQALDWSDENESV